MSTTTLVNGVGAAATYGMGGFASPTAGDRIAVNLAHRDRLLVAGGFGAAIAVITEISSRAPRAWSPLV
ncbi:MAG TPA: hypothetical protein VLC50_04510 [Actinomycetes bacterium]|nr:hypothetical protein [Actinomycetes bacterium]